MIANLANDAEIVYGQTLGLDSRGFRNAERNWSIQSFSTFFTELHAF
jgi:hypothetical protein